MFFRLISGSMSHTLTTSTRARRLTRKYGIATEERSYDSRQIVFIPEKSAEAWKSARPTNVMVGAIVSGPTKRSRNPTRPVKPIRIWNMAATIMAP